MLLSSADNCCELQGDAAAVDIDPAPPHPRPVRPSSPQALSRKGRGELLRRSSSRRAEIVRRAYVWREWEFWVIAIAALSLYCARLTAIPIRGEETRRAQVACEMLCTGDWIVPRQQGVPLLSRPPLGSYPIALAAMLLGDCSLLAVRLPSALATILTILLIYAYARRFMPRLGSLAAGLAYATMGQVLVLGRLAETEATFTLFVSSALLVWHWGYIERWRPSWPWLAGYGLAALATLAKGPQAPVYFAAPVCMYLAWRRDWQSLFSRWHLAGAAIFVAIVAVWQIPFWVEMGWPAVKTVWLGDVGMRFDDTRWQTVLLHLLEYPLEIAVCTLPWSPLLAAFLSKRFRQSVGNAAPMVVFLGLAIGLAFVTCWVVPGARGRYFMPLYPCMALLVGLSVERIARPVAADWQRRGWTWFLLSTAVLAVSAGVSIAALTWIVPRRFPPLEQPEWFAAIFLAASLATASLLVAFRAKFGSRGMRISIITVAGFIGLSFVGVIVNGTAATAVDPAPDVVRLKQTLPAGTRLVSFGLVETLFTYLYREPIDEQPWPKRLSEVGPGVDYFCFTWDRPAAPSLPFSWQIEAIIPCDRVRRQRPLKKVIIGRRIDSLAGGMQ